MCPFFLSKCITNHTGDIDSCEESISRRNQFLLGNQFLGTDFHFGLVFTLFELIYFHTGIRTRAVSQWPAHYHLSYAAL
jgi:hypothetical protein